MDDTAHAIELVKGNRFRQGMFEARASKEIGLQSQSEQMTRSNQDMKIAFKAWLGLSHSDGRDLYHRLLASKTAGTTAWIWANVIFINWLNNTAASSVDRLICITGKHGCGKSVLAATLSDALSKKDDRHTFFFSFSGIEAGSQVPERMIGCILWQLLATLDDSQSSDIMKDLMVKGSPMMTDLWEALQKAASLTARPIVCIIDGLDECRSTDRSPLTLIGELLQAHCNARALLIGRPHVLKNVPGIQNVIEMGPETVRPEIGTFLRSELEKSELFRDGEIRQHVFNSIMEGAEGMFLWAKLMVNDLQRSSSKHEVRERLQKLPRGLVQTYRHLLSQLLNELDELELRLANTILSLSSVSYRRFTLSEIQYACALNAKAESAASKNQELNDFLLSKPAQSIAKVCRGLVVIEDGAISLAHFSAKEFLTRPAHEWTSEQDRDLKVFRVDLAKSNSTLGCLCIDYMQCTEYSYQVQELDGEFECGQDHPFLDYACKYMTHHFGQAEIHSTNTTAKISSFVQSPKCAAWLQLFWCLSNSEHSTGRELDSLVQFASWFKDGVNPGEESELSTQTSESRNVATDHSPQHIDLQLKPWDMIIKALSFDSSGPFFDDKQDLSPNVVIDTLQRTQAENEKLLHSLDQQGRLSSRWHIRCARSLMQSPIKSDLVKRILPNSFRVSPYVLVVAGMRHAAEGNHQDALEVFKAGLAKMESRDTLLKNYLLFQIGVTYSTLGQHHEALRHAKDAEPGIRKYFGEKHPFALGLCNLIGSFYHAIRDYENALIWKEKAFNGIRALKGDHPDTVQIMFGLSQTHEALHHYQIARELMETTHRMSQKVNGERHEMTLDSTFALGKLCKLCGDKENTLRWMRASYDIDKAIFGQSHPYTVLSAYETGSAFRKLGDMEEALKWYNIAFDNDRDNAYARDMKYGALYATEICLNRKDYRHAFKWAVTTFNLCQRCAPSNHQVALDAQWYIGLIYFRFHHYKQAIKCFTVALIGYGATFGLGSEAALTLIHHRGVVSLALGRYSEALESFQKSCSGQAQLSKQQSCPSYKMDVDVRWSHALLGDEREALAWAKRVLDDYNATGGQDAQRRLLMKHLLLVIESYRIPNPLTLACDTSTPMNRSERLVVLLPGNSRGRPPTLCTKQYLNSIHEALRLSRATKTPRHRECDHPQRPRNSKIPIHPQRVKNRRKYGNAALVYEPPLVKPTKEILVLSCSEKINCHTELREDIDDDDDDDDCYNHDGYDSDDYDDTEEEEDEEEEEDDSFDHFWSDDSDDSDDSGTSGNSGEGSSDSEKLDKGLISKLKGLSMWSPPAPPAPPPPLPCPHANDLCSILRK